ncbi:MAG TPA: outer membrane beta-barrel family protein [Chitinophagales bacterium]|nr:outer membrane beta-barrel family protein [Chitinophagales bacterium]
MKKVFACLAFGLFVLVLPNVLMAQMPGGGNGGKGGGGGLQNMLQQQGIKMNVGHIYGKVVDPKTGKGIEFASVALYTTHGDSLTGGQLTETNGDFSLDNLPLGSYKLKITYVGYKPMEKNVVVTFKNGEQDLGDLAMEEDATTMKAVTVTAEKSTIELKPDRKVFNVDKDLSARGGTGIDVMKNIPGVSTDADGNVTLRNASPNIYIDGKPTTLTLDQIPADQIEKVEVITNPSAKFEASATGGIINVVLKKNQKPGYNGMVSMALGTNKQYNGMALLNVHEKKFGFLLAYNIHGATNDVYSYTDRRSLNNGETTGYFHQDDNSIDKRLFQVGRIGLDYNASNRTSLSLSENMVFGRFETNDNGSYSTSDSSNTLKLSGNRNTDRVVNFRNFTTDFSIHHTYPVEDKEWTLDLNYNRSRGGTNYTYDFTTYDPIGNLIPYNLADNPESETDSTGTSSNMVTAQWDFADPINKDMKIEFGVRSNYQRQFATPVVYDQVGDSINPVPNLSLRYRTDNLINAAYVTFSHQVKNFSYQLGLRFEETYFVGKLLDSVNGTFSYGYPSSINNLYNALFPSLSLSQKWGEKHELQFNITRKIKRPNFFQVSPFIFASDMYDYRIGNPALQPEFDNKAELNYDLTLDKFTWLSSLYGSFDQQPITQYSYAQDSSNILINTFENAKNSWEYGWENTIKVTPVKGLDITADGTVYYNSIVSNVSGAEINNHGYSYTIKGIISYKFPLGIVGQINGTYEAPRIIPQGHTLPLYFFDLSVSKDLGIVSFNLSVSDVLNSKVHGNYYDTPTYIQTNTHRRDVRYARLGMSIKFGKLDSSIFKLKKQLKKEQQNAPSGDDLGF